MHYLKWAKLHKRVTYELTGSGVPPARLGDLGDELLSVSLEVRGGYGDPAILAGVAKLYNVPIECVIPVPGTSTANFLALAVSAGRGDMVLVENPVYDPLVRAAEFLNLSVLPVSRTPGLGFSTVLEQIETGLKQGAKALVLTNLQNPSGNYLRLGEIQEIAAMCRARGAGLIVDEVYLDAVAIVRGEKRWTAAAVADHVIATGSLTKVYGFGGLRTGWLLAAPHLAERARDVMDLLSVENAAPAAAVAVRAFANLPHLEARYRGIHAEGQAVFRAWLAEQPYLLGYGNHGALFECVRLPDGLDPCELNDRLVSHYDTQLVSGRFFGLDRHVRISTGAEPDVLREGLARIGDAVRELAR